MLKECNTKQMPEKFATVTMERTEERGRPRDRLRDEVELEL